MLSPQGRDPAAAEWRTRRVDIALAEQIFPYSWDLGRLLSVAADRLPDGNLAFTSKNCGKRIMPGLPIRPMQLHAQHVLVALPGLAKHEAVLGRRVTVQDRLMEGGFVPHCVEDFV